MRWSRFLVITLLMTSAALMVSADEEPLDPDDVDRTDFSDPALEEDKAPAVATGPHSEVDSASIFPELPDGKIPVGVTNLMLASLANSGGKMFNVSAIEGVLENEDGVTLQKFKRWEYGEPLGPREQRSFRYPFKIDGEIAPGSYKMGFKVYYNNRDKDPFLSEVYNETTELIPEPPSYEARMRMIQLGAGGLAVLLLVGLLMSLMPGGKPAKSGSKEAKPKPAKATSQEDEWLKDTLAGSEGTVPKKKAGKTKRN
jgi:hypothetical protein